MWISLLVVERLHGSITMINTIMLGVGIGMAIPCAVLSFVKPTNRCIYYLAIVALIAFVLVQIIIELLFHFNDNTVLDTSLWVAYCIMYVCITASQEVFLTSSLAQMVSSKYQVFADGVRLTVYRLGAVLTLAISALIFDYMIVVSPVHISFMLMCLGLLVWRGKMLSEPVIVI